MADIIIDSSKSLELNWTAKGNDRVIQNVYNILNTRKSDVAYNREFGISPDVFDNDVETSKILLMEDLEEQIRINEPRAKLKSIDIQGVTAEGEIAVVVKIEV